MTEVPTEEARQVQFETVDVDAALALLQQAIDQPGKGHGFIYMPPSGEGTTCRYTHGNEPGCIVGWALYLNGAPLSVLRSGDCQGGLPADTWLSFADVKAKLPFTVTPLARQVFRMAQSAQDGRQPWGIAKEIAQRFADENRESAR